MNISFQCSFSLRSNLQPLLLAAVSLVALAGLQPAMAQPNISVTNLGANADGNLQWRVDVLPDATLFTDGDGSLAAELGFELTGSTFLEATVNDTDWPFANPGFNPFSDTITTGTSLSDAELFVAYGSDPVGESVELLTITTQGDSETMLLWGGYTIRPGQPGSFTGGRIAQAGVNFDEIAGSLSSGGGGLIGDCNGDGIINAEDLSCVCGDGTLDDVLQATGLIAGDLDGDGEVAFADFLALSGNFGISGVGYAGGDIDCDGEVAFADFLTLSGNFGNSSAEILATVPEPGFGWALPCIALAWLAIRKR